MYVCIKGSAATTPQPHQVLTEHIYPECHQLNSKVVCVYIVCMGGGGGGGGVGMGGVERGIGGISIIEFAFKAEYEDGVERGVGRIFFVIELAFKAEYEQICQHTPSVLPAHPTGSKERPPDHR